MSKTNAARLLDRLGVSYALRDYDVDVEHLGAEQVAARLGLPAAQVFKTLVVRGDRSGVLLALLPADRELDLKALARLSGDRKVEPVALREVEPLTGYVRGGVTALACRRAYPVFLDESAGAHALISVSAGVRGTQLVLAPLDYARAVQAAWGRFAKDKPKA